MLSKVCNHEDRYAITRARSDTLKSSRDAVNFCRKVVNRNLFSKRKASSKHPKMNSLRKLPAIR